jgi:hypothetical protein
MGANASAIVGELYKRIGTLPADKAAIVGGAREPSRRGA